MSDAVGAFLGPVPVLSAQEESTDGTGSEPHVGLKGDTRTGQTDVACLEEELAASAA